MSLARKEIWQVRLKSLVSILLVLFAGLVLRIFQKSVIEHSKYSEIAQKQYRDERTIEAERGNIYFYDKTDLTPATLNVQKYQILVVPKNTPDKNEIAKQLATILSLDEKDIFEKINNDKLYVPPIAKKVDKKLADQIEALKLKDVQIFPDYVREYPEKELASHILGFVNHEFSGNYGVEQYYEKILKGEPGLLVAEKDNKGRIIDFLNEDIKAKNGGSIVLTVEKNVQYKMEQILKEGMDFSDAENGQIIVVEPKSGKILAMASSPNFDPNLFNEVAEENKDREFSIFVNPAVSFAYEPGSIFKPIIVSLGLDNEKFEPDTKGGPFSNMTVVQGYEIHTALNKGYGDETVTQILENSDNVGMVWVGNQIGNDLMREGLEKFGFNEKTGIDLPGETTGTILSLKNWRDIHRANISFGQGVLVTPLQIAQAYATIANDGEMPRLHIVDKIIRKDGSEEPIENTTVRRVIKIETANEVKQMMQSVVDVGQSSKTKIEGYNIGGKTGTAQIAKKDGTGYEENSFNHSFAGIGPITNPKFVVVIRLEKPTVTRFADATVLPMFKKAMQFLLSYYQIPKDY